VEFVYIGLLVIINLIKNSLLGWQLPHGQEALRYDPLYIYVNEIVVLFKYEEFILFVLQTSLGPGIGNI
jgi:hypothetical protein